MYNYHSRNLFRFLLLTITSLTCMNGLAFAWSRHNIVTKASIQKITWLSSFESVLVTVQENKDSSINPQFEVIYRNPQQSEMVITPAQFVYYDLKITRYGFQGAGRGETVTALMTLTDYSDEPDWGMDQNMTLSWEQKFMGGSQGFRHMYYPGLTIHFPYLFWPQGQAPQRAEYFYKLALKALSGGDLYWGFRQLSRSLHYIQDLADPYHTAQSNFTFTHFDSPVAGTSETTKNYHLAYESLIARILELEVGGQLPPNYIKVLNNTPAIEAENLKELALTIAKESHALADDTFNISVEVLGEKFLRKEPTSLTAADVDAFLKNPRRKEFDAQAKAALALAAGGSKALLNLTYKELHEQKGK